MTSSVPRDRRRLVVRALVLGALVVVVTLGALHLELLCDDAFITFRYVSNAMDGHGLVWNAPPFQPVEGYTGFLWALLLWATWSWFGIEPPDAANVLSITCGIATFAIAARTAFRIRGRDGAPVADVVVFAALALIAVNRTFLQWTTSGLETALFVLAAVAWCTAAFRGREGRTTRWLVGWSCAAAAAALTRPDGVLFASATAAAVAMELARRRLRIRAALIGCSPLLLVVAHVAWRRWFYGEWVPNTWFAKVGDPWPAAGLRYLLLFVVENGAWIWCALLLVWLVVEARRGARTAWRALLENVPAVAAVGAIVAVTGYYVFVVGGDHFEFRVFAHLVPLGALAALAMVVRVARGAEGPVVVLASITFASGLAWGIAAVQPTATLFYEPLAAHVPSWARPFAQWYDRHRAWLALQAVGGRCDLHRAFLASEVLGLPERARTSHPENDVPVIARDCVGWLGWVLPDVAVVDRLGLNDWVAARWPEPRDGRDVPTPIENVLAGADHDGDGAVTLAEVTVLAGTEGIDAAATVAAARQMFLIFGESPDVLRTSELPAIREFLRDLRTMAHERHAPAAYVAAFAPNATIVDRRLVVSPRSRPLDAERVREIEAEWRQRVRSMR